MSDLPQRPTIEQLYQWWWLHDGRWYQEVADRFGFDVANELNRRAGKFVASRVGRSVARALGRPIHELPWPDVVDVFETCPTLMWPGELMDADLRVTGPGCFETNITRNYALVMLQRAGTLERYDCPCLQVREGWFEGLGLELVEQTRSQCLRMGGSACTIVARVAGFGPAPDPG